MKKLLYRMVPHNGGAVFAEESRALQIVQINRAIKNSKTWGEFKRSMPREEYQRIVGLLEFEEEGQTEPDPDEEFDGMWLIEEGDYPDWLQPEMDNAISRDILEWFGKRTDTFMNGSYWHISEGNMDAVANTLRDRGYTVEKAQEMPFW